MLTAARARPLSGDAPWRIRASARSEDHGLPRARRDAGRDKTSGSRRPVVRGWADTIQDGDRLAGTHVASRAAASMAEGGRSMRVLGGVTVVGLLAITAIQDASAQAPRSPTPAPTDGVVRAETVARGLEHPWGLAFLPDGRMLVTERPGRLRIVDRDGRAVRAPRRRAGGGGAGPGRPARRRARPALRREPPRLPLLRGARAASGTAGTAVARGRLGEGRLEDVRVIYQQQPKVDGPNHFGSRLVFARDGTLFVTQGDRFAHREQAQDLSVGFGKIVRINPDGSVPRDNPFVGRADARPEIWSYGHRNVQSAALHPRDRPALDGGARRARRRRAEPARRPARTTAGPSSPTGSTTRARRSARARRSRAWSSRSTTGIP